jgi:hypothetical protein
MTSFSLWTYRQPKNEPDVQVIYKIGTTPTLSMDLAL